MSRTPSRQPPSRPTRPLSASTAYTQYTNETGTHDIHTMLALSDFPAPPTSLPTPTSGGGSGSFPRTPTRPIGSSSSHSRNSHITTTTNQEEILQDYFIASLLNSSYPSPGLEAEAAWPDSPRSYVDPTRTSSRPSVDQRLRYIPSSPTLSAYTSAPPLPLSPPPPLPSLPSPLLQAYFPDHNSPNISPGPESESSYSQTSYGTGSVTNRSRSTAIVRVSSPPSVPTPGATTVLGYARAAYVPKSSIVSSPPPITTSLYSPSNLIDLSSPRSPSRAALSPRISYLPNLPPPSPDSPVVDTLGPLPGPSRYRSSLTPSPRTEAPPNVPEDILSPDDPGPSTSYFDRATTKQRNRISMTSIFSKFSRSTSISSKRSRWRNRKDLPPLPMPVPRRPTDPREIEKQESEMGLPALMKRAGFLAQLLDTGRTASISTYHHVPPSSPHPLSNPSFAHSASVAPSDTPPQGSPWEYSSGSGYVDATAVRNRTSQSIKSFFTRGTGTDPSGHFNVLDEELQRRYLDEIATNSAHGTSIAYQSASGSHHATEGVFLPSQNSSEKRRRITIVDQPPPVRSLRRRIPRPWTWKKRTLFAVFVNFALLVAVVSTVASVLAPHHSKSSSSVSTTPQSNCSGNFTGSLCDLDATCVCTEGGTTACSPLAVAIRNILPTTNSLLKTSFTEGPVALTLWDTEGSPVGGNCAAQAVLIDTNPKNADAAHTAWARSAVLWSVLQSQDLISARALRTFVNGLDFASSGSSRRASSYQTESAGFAFDFLTMTITAPRTTWRADANPPDAQTAIVSPALESVLDSFYTSSNALSTQSGVALQNYWTKDLKLDSAKLPTFIAAFQAAPVLLPFDMTLNSNGKSLTSVMQLHNPKTISFPLAQGCNPMMTAIQLKALNAIEQTAFGLSPVSQLPTSFDTNCFTNRPVYGVLDVLRLRLPFVSGAPLQAAVLSADASSRLLVRSGAALSAYPTAAGKDVPIEALVSDNYGTMSHLNHVILTYLKALPVAQAAALVAFILGGTNPPSASLTVPLDSIPVIEVALFGGVGPTDVDHSVSSIATPSGSLFFGSADATVFRAWAINVAMSTSETVVWTNSSMSAEVVREAPGSDTTFGQIWTGAGTMISNAYTVGTTTTTADVARVIGVLKQTGYMAS